MFGFITTFLVGMVCIILGISNMRGNISSLHSYHRHKVAKKDELPLGKRVGLGTIICGAAIIVFTVFGTLTIYTENQKFIIIGSVLLLSGLVAGLVIALHAIIKYNNGLF